MAQILLLEADKLLARTYTRSLASAGHTVHWQSDPQAALTVLDENQIELIILELQLVGHNGVEFLYELRSYLDWEAIPVILHTMVSPEHPGLGRVFWKELGITGYYYKPQTSLKQLEQHVTYHLVNVAA